MNSKTGVGKLTGIVALFVLLVIGFMSPDTAQAQDPTETPIPIVDYVEIETGEYVAIERTVSFGDMAVVISLLAVLATIYINFIWRMVADKLP